MKKTGLKEKFKALKEQFQENKKAFGLYLVLRVLVIIVMIMQFFNGNYENVFLCILTLILFFVPSFIQLNYHIKLPDTLEVIILLFIFAAEILGEIQEYYIIFPFWDMMLHTLNGFLAAAIGFSMVDILNRNEQFSVRLSPIFMSIVAFCFSMTIGVMWEFFEFTMDMLFQLDMQKDTIVSTISSVMLDPAGGNVPTKITGIEEVYIHGRPLGLGGYLDIGLIDTMNDLFVNFIGALTFSAIGYIYVKYRGKLKFASRFIPIVRETIRKTEHK